MKLAESRRYSTSIGPCPRSRPWPPTGLLRTPPASTGPVTVSITAQKSSGAANKTHSRFLAMTKVTNYSPGVAKAHKKSSGAANKTYSSSSGSAKANNKASGSDQASKM